MSTKFFIIICILCLAFSCSKKDELDYDDIVMTDEQGNIIGNNSSNQWTPATMDTVGEEPYINHLNFYIDSVYNGNNNLELNFYCDLPDTLEIIAYPNPVSNVENVKVKLRSSKGICIYTFGYQGLIGRFPGGGAATGEFYQNNVSECKKEFDLENLSEQINFPTDDFRLGFTVITEDGCVYQVYGNVMVL